VHVCNVASLKRIFVAAMKNLVENQCQFYFKKFKCGDDQISSLGFITPRINS